MNFIASVPEKLHCTLERMTNCPGNSQITDHGGKFVITQGYDHGVTGPNLSQDFAKTAFPFPYDFPYEDFDYFHCLQFDDVI